MLSATIAATVSQLPHIRSHADVAPYISLSMLAVQALGYTATLVTEAKMLPAWPTHNYRTYADHLQCSMYCSVKALTLVALLLTARLAQKVWRSRAKARARSPVEPWRVPSESAALLYSFGVHLGGLFFVFAVHWLSTYGTSMLPPRVPYAEEAHVTSSCMRTLTAVVERYVGVAKEWFLLPQFIGNVVWQVNCKPLAVRYYAGVTIVWLLPHVYGYLRPQVVTMYSEAYDNVADSYSKAGAVVVPIVGVILALAVYLQQQWNYNIVGWTMRTEQNKVLHVY